MSESIVPQTYDQWKHCIEVACRLELRVDYIQSRLRALDDPADHHTQQFVRRWGQPHLAKVRLWFEQAAAEVRAAGRDP